MTLPELFRSSLVGMADTGGLEFGGTEYSFGELEQAAAKTAGWLTSKGLTKGDRIAVYLPNCLELIHLYLAATRLGLIFTPMNVLYRGREIENILSDAAPKLLFTTSDMAPLASDAAEGADVPVILVEDLGSLAARAAPSQSTELEDGTIAALVYTSGTTGKPKGAMLSHENFAANARNINECWRM